MIKTISFGFCVFLIAFISLEKARPPDYIMLEFGGEPLDKPVPSIVFSIDSFHKEITMYVYVYYINKCEYLLISQEIKESGIAQKIDTSDVGYYNFFVVRKNIKEAYATFSTEKTKELFMVLLEQIQDKGSKARIKESFIDILKRI